MFFKSSYGNQHLFFTINVEGQGACPAPSGYSCKNKSGGWQTTSCCPPRGIRVSVAVGSCQLYQYKAALQIMPTSPCFSKMATCSVSFSGTHTSSPSRNAHTCRRPFSSPGSRSTHPFVLMRFVFQVMYPPRVLIGVLSGNGSAPVRGAIVHQEQFPVAIGLG